MDRLSDREVPPDKHLCMALIVKGKNGSPPRVHSVETFAALVQATEPLSSGP